MNVFTRMGSENTERLLLTGTLALFAGVGSLQQASASLSYSVAGSSYSQNFNSLPNSPANTSLQATIPWTDDSTSSSSQTSLPGWYLYHPTSQSEGGANGHQRFRIGPGTSTTGAFYSFGTAGGSDRALGDLGASTIGPDGQTGNDAGNLYIALRLRNDTGVALEHFTLSFTGEQWHAGGTAARETMTFGWSTAATAINDPSTLFQSVPALSWTSPTALGAEGAVDGTANFVVISPVTVTGMLWAPGTDLWLRWTDPQFSGVRDDGMAIDDLTFTAVIPEPATGSLALLGSLALVIRRFARRG